MSDTNITRPNIDRQQRRIDDDKLRRLASHNIDDLKRAFKAGAAFVGGEGPVYGVDHAFERWYASLDK